MTGASCYETSVLRAFVMAHGTLREDGQLMTLNDTIVDYGEREKLARWWEQPTIPMSKVDFFLMRHDLMLFELEHWAEQALGRDGFVDPFSEPSTLAG